MFSFWVIFEVTYNNGDAFKLRLLRQFLTVYTTLPSTLLLFMFVSSVQNGYSTDFGNKGYKNTESAKSYENSVSLYVFSSMKAAAQCTRVVSGDFLVNLAVKYYNVGNSGLLLYYYWYIIILSYYHRVIIMRS